MSIPSNSILLDAPAVLAKAGVRAGSVVADMGCGTSGHFVIPAARMIGPTGRVYAIDILKSVLAAVESRAKLEGVNSIETLWGNCEMWKGVKIADNAVDIALVINNLYLAKNRQIFLSEAARLTKVGGKVIVIDWKTVASPLGPPDASRVSPEAAKADAMAAGLRFVEAWDPAPYFWGLIFAK
jgi:Methylase involved in ubiquinone/menaquinone biosynthesis